MSARVGSSPAGVRRLLIGALCTLVLALALSASAKAEIPNHPFIGALISGLEPEPKPLRPRLEKPCGVTVTPEGAIYVSDYARQSVIGTSLTELFPENGPCGLAYDGNNLYVNEFHGTVVNPETGVIDAGRATGIAVQPITKDLYVSHRNSVAVYEAPVEPGKLPADVFGTGRSATPTASRSRPSRAPKGTSTSPTPPTTPSRSTIRRSDLTQVIDGANTAAGRFVSLADSSLAVDQSNGNLFIVDNTTPLAEHPAAAVYEFNADGVFRGQLEHSIVDGMPVGIAIDESATPANGEVYVTSGNGTSVVIPPELGPPVTEQGALYAFGPAGPGQTIEVSTSGTGNGTVTSNPVGINCPSGCEAELNSGASVTLTATPEAGSAFEGWTGGGCSGTGICQVILNSATSVDAKFGPRAGQRRPTCGRHERRCPGGFQRPIRRRHRRAEARQGERQGRDGHPRGDGPRTGHPDGRRQGHEASTCQLHRRRRRDPAPAPRRLRQKGPRQAPQRPPRTAGRRHLQAQRRQRRHHRAQDRHLRANQVAGGR